MQSLEELLRTQLTTPIAAQQFYHALARHLDKSIPDIDSTIDIDFETTQLLALLYKDEQYRDIICRLRPHFANQTIDPDNDPLQDTHAPNSPISDETHPKLTLGTTITHPSQLERLGRESIHYSKSFLSDSTGYGDAWLAADEVLQRKVLLKELELTERTPTAKTEEFVREAQIAGQLEHPNILPVYSLAWSAENTPYYTMRFVDGISLTQLVRQLHDDHNALNRITLKPALDAVIAVCNAISFAHSRGVYHSHLDSNSVSLGEFGEVMVLNWSQAVVANQTSDLKQLQRGDLTAIGALLYEIATGTPPSTHSLETISQLPSSTPAVIRSVILECFFDDSRYSDISALAQDLTAFLHDHPTLVHQDSIREATGRWVRHHPMHVIYSVAAAVLVLFTLVTETFILRTANEQAQQSLDFTRHLSAFLFRDNQRIEEERREEQIAEETALKSLSIAESLLLEAEKNATLAKKQQDIALTLEKKSIQLQNLATTNYRQALEQDAIAESLLLRAQQDEQRAAEATESITQSSIRAFQSQMLFHAANGDIDLALENATNLATLHPAGNIDSIQESRFLSTLCARSYVPNSTLSLQARFNPDTTRIFSVSPSQALSFANYDPSKLETVVYTVDRKLAHHHHVINGRVDYHFSVDDKLVTLSNDIDGCIVAIHKDKHVDFGRLPHPCTAATINNSNLYAALNNGTVVKFSLTDLTASSPLLTLSANAHQLAISADGDLMSVAFSTSLQVHSLPAGKLLHSVPLPSQAEAMWFASEGRIAVITNQYYVNEFLFNENIVRRIRFRPPAHDNHLVSQLNTPAAHYLLFSKGTLVRLDSQLNPTLSNSSRLHFGTILDGDENGLLVTNRTGTLHILDPSTLRPLENPILNSRPFIGAKRTTDGLLTVDALGNVQTYAPPFYQRSSPLTPPETSSKFDLLADGSSCYLTENNSLLIHSRKQNNPIRYEHPKPILDLRVLAHGHILSLRDASETILFTVAEEQLQEQLRVPGSLEFAGVHYNPASFTLLVATKTTLYKVIKDELHTFTHPQELNGLLQLAVDHQRDTILLCSSDVHSLVYRIGLQDLIYSQLHEFPGFIRDPFWDSKRNQFGFITTNSDNSKPHTLVTIRQDGSQEVKDLPYGLKMHHFDAGQSTLFLVTTDNKVLSYSWQEHVTLSSYQFTGIIEHTLLDPVKRVMLLQSPDGILILDAQRLSPLTPLIEGRFAAPKQVGASFYAIQIDGKLVHPLPLSSLINTDLTSVQIHAVLGTP